MKINSTTRSHIQKEIRNILKPTYFDDIPLSPLFDALKKHGLIVVQEDGMPWSGLLCGRDGDADFDLQMNGESVDNAVLSLQWYSMPSGRYEVTGYL